MIPLKLKNNNTATINIKDSSNINVIRRSDVPQTIKIKYFDPDMPRMELTVDGDWIDCRAARDYDLDPNTFNFTNDPLLIDLGFACKLPAGYEAHLAPRSSSFKRWGFLVVNSVGVIDESYCGEEDHWMLAVYPTRKAHINKYDRVCQFRIMKKQPEIIFEEVENLSNNSRGGFGSTGVK